MEDVMRRRILIIVGLVGIVVVLGILLFRGIGSGFGKSAATPTPVITKTIVYAAQDIPQGTIITEAYLQEGQWPQNVAYDYLITDKSTVIGKRARIDVKRGEPLLTTAVLKEGDQLMDPGSLIASKIANGKVAIAIPLSRLSGVAYGIRNGDHIAIIASLLFIDMDVNTQSQTPINKLILNVDQTGKLNQVQVMSGDKFSESPLTDSSAVLGAYFVPVEAQRPRLASAVIVANAKVLNVGTVNSDLAPAVSGATPQPAGAAKAQTAAAPINPDILVVEVTPEEAISLDFIIRLRGDLTYALRAMGDSTPISLPSWDLKRLMENRKIDLPAKLNYGVSNRMDNIFVPVLGNDVVVQAR
jgi:Flp pilus assembly protein CpaB